MRKVRAALYLVMGGIIAVMAGPVWADWAVNMPVGVTSISREIYSIHMIIFWICVVIGVGVFGVMFYSMWKHRKSQGAKAANFHESHIVEAVWTVIPFFILIGMAIPAAKALIRMEDTSGSELTIKITAYQWMWQYEYLENDISFYSRLGAESNAARQRNSGIDPATVANYLLDVDNALVLPVDTKIRLLTTAADVIHAWWVPELGGKKDAIPGYINEMWTQIDKPGVYRGQCAELCGKDHGFMPIVVKAVSKEEYRVWVAEQGGQPVQQAASL